MGETQAEAILRAWQEAGLTILAGPEAAATPATAWFARVADEGPTFHGATLVDALAQLATWLLHSVKP
jgi:hypothetical protein